MTEFITKLDKKNGGFCVVNMYCFMLNHTLYTHNTRTNYYYKWVKSKVSDKYVMQRISKSEFNYKQYKITSYIIINGFNIKIKEDANAKYGTNKGRR